MDKAWAQELLCQMLGPHATFREGQWEAIEAIALRAQRVLVVQRTGWGKSIVYFLATRMLRDKGCGPALLISPLLSLMRNQLLAAEKLGLRAAAIHSENQEDWQNVRAQIQARECDLLMISPERLGNSAFFDEFLPLFRGNLGLLVIDEAHCISDWGHDFRPDYRRIVRILRMLPAAVPVLCTTATANNRVVTDIANQVPDITVLRGPLIRSSLKLFDIKLADQAERLAWLAHFLPKLRGSGIVYCLTVEDTRRVASWLVNNGIAARAYHADLEASDRVACESMLLSNEVKCLVATVALGMGFDKPDLGFVIHFQRPGSPVAYYQQVGRAGRAVDSAYGVLLSGAEDDDIQNYFINSAFPPAETQLRVLQKIEQSANGLSLEGVSAQLNASRSSIEKALKLLEVDGALQREKSLFIRTANPWKPDLVRADKITAVRREELQQIKLYVEHDGCLMEFLARALDDPFAEKCGKCMNCARQHTRQRAPAELVRKAKAYLCSEPLIFSARTCWPKTLLPLLDKQGADLVQKERNEPRITIPPLYRAEMGRILSMYGDAGWGREVAAGKYSNGKFSDELIDACVRTVQTVWKPEPYPEWLTVAPSNEHAALMNDFAQRMAEKLKIPFRPIFVRTNGGPAQKRMQNSIYQLQNLLPLFRVTERPPAGPVLLLDDITDSGWTLTWLAVLLRKNGSGPVYPFALAKATPRSI